jgi:hypothetical protein
MIQGKLMPASILELPNRMIEVIFRETGTVMGLEYSGMSITVVCPYSDGRLNLRSEGTFILNTEDKDTLSWVGIGGTRGTERRGVTSWRGLKQYRTGIECIAALDKRRMVFEAEIEGQDGWLKEWKTK